MEQKNLNSITGRISVIEEPVQGKSWIKQNFLIQDLKNEGRYYYFLTFKEEVIHLLSRFMVGDQIQVYFNPDSKAGTNGRYYTDLIAWKINPVNLKANFNNDQE
jgi:hypothetical protein